MRTEIKALHQRLGTTAVYVTHDQVEAMTMADRIVVMNAGRIEQVGRPMDLYDRPSNLFVASFIGSPSINLMPGVAVSHDGVLKFDAGSGQLLALPAGLEIREHEEIVYAVRPKDLVPAEGATGLRAHVNVLEPTGSETFAYCSVGRHSICVQLDAREQLEPGHEIRLAPRMDHVHIFDKATGGRRHRG
jgi:multiple sugar transport system ATP-binding protein